MTNSRAMTTYWQYPADAHRRRTSGSRVSISAATQVPTVTQINEHPVTVKALNPAETHGV